MSTRTLLAVLVILAVIALGGWKSIRNTFGRDAVHVITRQLFHR